MPVYDTIIIGGGISGMTAAIYAARKRMNFLFITDKPGGQFMESGEVLNYPGITATSGAEFAKNMDEQLKFNKVDLKFPVKAQKLSKKGKNFSLKTSKGTYESKSVIITTGARPRELQVPGEEKYKRNGVAYCAVCDGPLFSGEDVAVIGGGNAALEAVDFLLKIAKKIYLINIEDKLRAHEYLQERIQNQKKVRIIHQAETSEILGDGKKVTGLRYRQGGKEHEIKVGGVFVDIGRVPNTDFVKGFLEFDKHNHIVIDCETRTSVEGVFAAGDCASGHEYQYVIAAGQGCMALLKAARYLARKS